MYEDSTVADDLTWDYLRGLGGQVVRRRKRNGLNDYTDMLHFNDMMGTAREEVNPTEVGSEVEGTPNGFVTTADGEPLKLQQPEEQETYYISSNSQFHGGFLEDKNFHTNPINDGVMGYFYRMGIRHYSPALGRFLQRDPFSYSRAPHKGNALSLNPYSYALNRPTQLSDRSGYQACPGGGCASPFGGAASIGMLPSDAGMGTDPDAPGGPGGGTVPGQDGVTCLRPYPAECKKEGIPEYCYPCCQWSDDPPWSGCCPGVTVVPGECGTGEPNDPNDPCNCACCWAGGEENAPTPIVGGFGGGSSWMSPYFGPPSIGPWGDWGQPWWILPMPFMGPWWRGFLTIPINSLYGNNSVSSNLFIAGSLIGIASMLPPGYLPPKPPWRKPSDLYPEAGPWGLAGFASQAIGWGIHGLCNRLIQKVKSEAAKGLCNIYFYCLCPACIDFNNCWSRYSTWVPIVGGIIGGIIGGFIGGIVFGPGGIIGGAAGGAGYAYGMMSTAVLTGCLLAALLRYDQCVRSMT